MTNNSESFICQMPTEILVLIFSSLSASELTLCRLVCSRFKHAVDVLARTDYVWREHCRIDFDGIFEITDIKARPGVYWFNIYKSLSLWPRITEARETQDEFAAASTVRDEIQNFQILKNGIIGVHKKHGIVYYDIETLDKSKRDDLTGEYLHYTENDNAIVILGYHLHLFVIRKFLSNPTYETDITFDNVKSFVLVDKKVFYVNLDDQIYVCHLDREKICQTLITHSEDGVMCLGYKDRLHVLTFQRNIYTIYEDDLVYTCGLGQDSNLLHNFREYNFLERMDWRVYIQWMYVLNRTIPEGPLRDIVAVRTYGDAVFVGSNWGVLRIYYAPYKDHYELDLFNTEPVKQYNFMERSDCPVLSMCPILQIDVLEGDESHTILVAMPKKIAILEFTHISKRSASVAMLPYSDPHKVKVLKLSEDQ